MAGVLNPYPNGARIGPLNGSPSDDFVFRFQLPDGSSTARDSNIAALAPNRIQRNFAAVYAPVPVAFGDQIPEEWKGNSAAEIVIDFEVVGIGRTAVTNTVRKLRKFMRKSSQSGEPPDLVFAIGAQHWVVRLHRLNESPTLWNTDTDEMRVKITATLHTLAWDD